MTFGSLFSGCGLMDLGLELAGHCCAWQCEIDPNARRVLAHHWPELPCHADVRDVVAHDLSPVDMITGGFPCQDLSVAGTREGLSSGSKSNLFFEMVRIVDELKPSFLLWENVPGLLSSFSPIEPPPLPMEGCEWEVEESSDFETVLYELDRIGYSGAVTTLDAQWFGVAQRRRRLFGLFARRHIGAKRCAEILSFANRSAGHLAASRQGGADVASTLRGRSANAGVNRPGRGGEDDQNLVVGTIDAHMGMGGLDANAAQAGHLVVQEPYNIVGLGQQGKNHAYPAVTTGSVQHKGNSALGNEAGTIVVAEIFETRIARNGRGQLSKVAHALRGRDVGGNSDCRPMLLAPGRMVRRLTPTECLRLMGAPDTFLDLDPPISDSAKYCLCGNGVVVPVAEWIGKRVLSYYGESD